MRSGKTAKIATALAALHLVFLCAGFIAPYDPNEQNRALPYAPPAVPQFRDSSGIWHLWPYIRAAKSSLDDDASTPSPDVAKVQFFVQGDSYQIVGPIRSRRHLFGAESGRKIFLLGTDEFGRDLFSRILYGGRISLLAGIVATCVSLSLGLAVGVLAGFYTGYFSRALNWVTDFFLALPWVYALLAVRAFLPLRLDPSLALLAVALIIGFVGWTRPARIIRGIVLSSKERGFVRTARGFGASDFHLLRRHIIPQTLGVLLTQAAILVPQYVLAEVTLSFLGLGASEPHASWGNLLAALQHYDVLVSYWWMYLPALALVPFCAGYSALASALHQRFGKAYL